MNEQELRAVVRAVVQKRIGAPGVHGPSSTVHGAATVQRAASAVQMVPEGVPFGSHASHFLYLQLVNDNGGACLIEPNVACNHCGYCQSHGH